VKLHGDGGKFIGNTIYTRDVNGNLVQLTRSGKHKNEQINAWFSYDNDGHILTRQDKPIGQ
jgi:hypothetical protein